MLKYQVRTLGRDKRRQSSSTTLKDVFNGGDANSVCGSEDLVWNHGATAAHLRTRGRSTSVSSLSSTSTSSVESSSVEWGPIKVYTSTVRPDTTYFTLFVNTATTTDELIQMTAARLRARPKDPQLFYLTMELDTKRDACDVRNVLVLDAASKPLELQACHPREKSKFVLQVRQSYPVKIYDFCLSNTSNYKSLLISQRTTCKEAVKMLLQMHKMHVNFKADHFVLVLVDSRSEQLLHPDESLAPIAQRLDNQQERIYIKPLAHVLQTVRTLDLAKMSKQFAEFVL